MENSGLEKIFQNIFEVNWESFFNLKELSLTDNSLKDEYETALKKLVHLGIFSFDGENNYSIKIHSGDNQKSVNPALENKTLYFVKLKDAIKVLQFFENSSLYVINN